MIPIKTPDEIKKMRSAGRAAAKVLNFGETLVRPGISTLEINDACEKFTRSLGCISAPLNYHGFPKSICTSINNVICHGIPSSKEILQEGDIVNLDITVIKDGFHGDTSRTICVGNVSEARRLLVERTQKAMMRGISVVREGGFFHEIGREIEQYLSKFGYGIVRDYTGHGIGKDFHEDPYIFHYATREKGLRFRAGMTFTIEPMVNASRRWEAILDKNDEWTVRTIDGADSAQFEHTILVTEKGSEILTRDEEKF